MKSSTIPCEIETAKARQCAGNSPVVRTFNRTTGFLSAEGFSVQRSEIEKFRNAISEIGNVQFIAMDYLHLWESWAGDSELAKHANLLKQRYSVEI